MDKTVMKLTYASSLTDLCEANKSFDKAVLKICYPGENRNKSYIAKSVLEKCAPTMYGCPVVCNYDRETDTLGGHDVDVFKDSEGHIQMVNITQPVGFVPESANYWFEEVEEDDGTINEYLCADVLLWKRQEAYQKIKKDGIVEHSMEITVNKGDVVDGVYVIDDFYFTAFCLIGVEPCFESSSLEFSMQDFKQQLSEMMQELKESFSMIDSSSEDDNKHPQDYSTEGGDNSLDKLIKELAEKYNIDLDNLEFSIDGMEIEEIEQKFAEIANAGEDPVEAAPAEEVFAADNETQEVTDTGVVVDAALETEDQPVAEEQDFALNSAVMEEIHRAVAEQKYMSQWGDEYTRYSVADIDQDACQVYCWDKQDGWLLYGFSYSMNGDAVAIDWNSRKRMKYAIVEFIESDEQPSPFEAMFSDMSNKLVSAIENVASIEALSNEVEELRKFKADIEKAAVDEKKQEIFSNFDDLANVDAFIDLQANAEQYDVETLEEKCYALRGRCMQVAKFSNDTKSTKLKVEKTTDDKEDKPYGGVVEIYTKK